MEHLSREIGRTVRYALASNARTARLIAISVVIALFYLFMHQVG